MSSEIQNDEYYLPGGLGTVSNGNQVFEITEKWKSKSTGIEILSLRPIPDGLQKMLNDVEQAKMDLEGKLGIPESRTGSGMVKYFDPKNDVAKSKCAQLIIYKQQVDKLFNFYTTEKQTS